MKENRIMVQFELSQEQKRVIPKETLVELTDRDMNKFLSESLKGNTKIVFEDPDRTRLEKTYYIFTPEQLLATLTNENLLKLAGFLEREVEARKKMLDFEEKS